MDIAFSVLIFFSEAIKILLLYPAQMTRVIQPVLCRKYVRLDIIL